MVNSSLAGPPQICGLFSTE